MAPPVGLSVFHQKIFKILLLRNYWANFYQISQKRSLGAPLPDSFKLWPPGPKWPHPRAYQFFIGKSSSHKIQSQFLPNFTEIFLRWSSFRFLQIITLRPKLAPPRGLSVFYRKIFKNILLRNYWTNFYQISQEYSLDAPLTGFFKLWPCAQNSPAQRLISFW